MIHRAKGGLVYYYISGPSKTARGFSSRERRPTMWWADRNEADRYFDLHPQEWKKGAYYCILDVFPGEAYYPTTQELDAIADEKAEAEWFHGHHPEDPTWLYLHGMEVK